MFNSKPVARKSEYRVSVKLLLMIIIAINFISCNSTNIYKEKYTFEDYSWSKNEKIIFKPEIKKTSIRYKGVIHIRYITGFSYKYLNFVLLIVHPDGGQSSKEISIQLLTNDKKYRGDGMGEIWDFDYELSEPILFSEPGKYQIEIKSAMGDETVNFINEIGLSLNKLD